MQKTRTRNFRYYLKWAFWVLVVQLVLANISAAIYAYKFTHFYAPPAARYSSGNIFEKTWKLFVGPRFYKNETEELPSFPYQTIRLFTTGQIPIEAWYSSLDTAKGCVIFFHGITANKAFLEKEAAMFRLWGYNVLLVDFRAHGRSGGSKCSFGVRETDEVQKAFAFARSRGNKKIILYGVSLGAAVCIKAVSEGGMDPAGIIADMPFDNLHHHLQSRARVLGFPAEPFAVLVTLWMGVENGYNGFRHDVGRYARGVHCPVLLEWGERDRYVHRPEVDEVFHQLSSAKKKLAVYPEADHESYLQVDPDAWQWEMKNFLDELVP